MENKEKMPEWDLSEYYNGVDDPKIGEDLNAYADKAAAFAAKYRGKVAGLDGAAFVAAEIELEYMSRRASILGGDASLYSSSHLTDAKASALYQRVVEGLNDAGKDLLFFALEYIKLDKAAEEKLLADEQVRFYLPYLKRVRKFKPYELSEEVEKTLLEKDVTSGSAWVRLYEEFMARLSYSVDG